MRRALVLAVVGALALTAQAQAQVCTVGSILPTTPKRLHGAPARELTASLGVLRRPGLSTDRLPMRWLATGGLDGLSFLVSAVNFDYVRQVAQTPAGTHVFVVPGYRTRYLVPSPYCLARLPRRERRVVLREERRDRRESRATLVELEFSDDGSWFESSSFAVSGIRSGGAMTVVSSLFEPSTTISGLVPDGVAEVVATAGDGAQASAPVRDNYFVLELPEAVGARTRLAVSWQASDGTIVKTFRYPPGPHRASWGYGGGGIDTDPYP